MKASKTKPAANTKAGSKGAEAKAIVPSAGGAEPGVGSPEHLADVERIGELLRNGPPIFACVMRSQMEASRLLLRAGHRLGTGPLPTEADLQAEKAAREQPQAAEAPADKSAGKEPADDGAEADEDGPDRVRRLTEIMEGVSFTPSPGIGRIPGALAVRQALQLQLRRVAGRREDVAAYVEQVQPCDETQVLENEPSEREAALLALAEIERLLDDLEDCMARWLCNVDCANIVELSAAALAAVEKLAAHDPYKLRCNVAFLVGAAAQHVADLPDADAIIAAAERARRTESERKCDAALAALGKPGTLNRDRTGWPWTRRDGSSWVSSKARGDKKVRVLA